MRSASIINDVSDAEGLDHSALVAVEPGAVAFIRCILKNAKKSIEKKHFLSFFSTG